MTDLRALLGVANEAMNRAAAIVSEKAVGTVTAKGDRDMVSELDVAVEEDLRAFLSAETPEVGFLGEEQGGRGLSSECTWSLDPIDGTANLVKGLPLCGISLGLFQDGRAVLGVIDLPFLGERYEAAEGHGAYRAGQRIRPSGTARMCDAVVAIGDYAVGDGAVERNRQRLEVTRLLAERALRIRMLGSAAIDLTWVASGRIDATIALSNHPWDMAAGVAIAREAGAHVMDTDGQPHRLTSTATITAAPGLRDQILELLRESAP
ncbi:inositol monophosphatase family protein [Streptomyces sp. BE147]|uniref:inositol monophosphatase family protein n=1 Tax=Streptomyces sp. BE147 TaxID=3002524 RepID=UPI002E792574|nr:inositol monophosphatase family protein [Streptomyces sp. BE147]MEE1741190.1 inositol monophosphatase family protein [Streptomyces sp. BE147]